MMFRSILHLILLKITKLMLFFSILAVFVWFLHIKVSLDYKMNLNFLEYGPKSTTNFLSGGGGGGGGGGVFAPGCICSYLV